MTDVLEMLKAIQFATAAHNKQTRKATGMPYIIHPITVAKILAEEAGIDDIAILQAAVLHDVVEDTKVKLEEIAVQFGGVVARIVAEVTDDKSQSKADRKRAQIEHASRMTREARLVKLADKLQNLRDLSECAPPDWTVERMQGYFVWCKAVICSMPTTNGVLESKLLMLIDQGWTVWKDGTRHPHVPEGDEHEMLEKYLASFGDSK